VIVMAETYQPIGFCPGCGYKMDAGTCPECGREVPEPLAHYWGEGGFRTGVVAVGLAILVLVFSYVVVFALQLAVTRWIGAR